MSLMIEVMQEAQRDVRCFGRAPSLPHPAGKCWHIWPTRLTAVGGFVRGTMYDVLVRARCAGGGCEAEGEAEPTY